MDAYSGNATNQIVDGLLQSARVLHAKIRIGRKPVMLANSSERRNLLDRVNPQLGLEIECRLNHLFGIPGSLDQLDEELGVHALPHLLGRDCRRRCGGCARVGGSIRAMDWRGSREW